MVTAGKPNKKDSKRHVPSKTSFTSPFTSKWKPLPQKDMQFILQTLKDNIVSLGLEKKEVKVFRPWRKKKKDKNPASLDPVPEVSKDPPEQDPPKNGWTDVAVRRQLAIGINEVTKALERNELKLLLVCKSVKPKHMTDHLIALSATRHVPACQVPQLSETVSEPLGLKSVLALGFRHCAPEDSGAFTDTVEAITPRVPSLDVAWLRGGAQSVKPKDSGGPEEEKEGEDVGEKKGQKRKRESVTEVTDSAASSCTLQPLTVKKIVANPAKKKKTKAKS